MCYDLLLLLFLDELGISSSSSVSVAINGDRVADIRPLGHIQTVQVEVEPNSDNEDGDQDDEKPPAIEDDTNGISPSSPTPPDQPPPATPNQHLPPTQAQSLPLSPAQPLTDIKPVAGLGEHPSSLPAVIGQGRHSPLSLPAVAEGLQEAGRKAASTNRKSKKSKPLSTKDLLPLHQDVGQSNKQLLEPATPEFKPTAEWVCNYTSACSYQHLCIIKTQ